MTAKKNWLPRIILISILFCGRVTAAPDQFTLFVPAFEVGTSGVTAVSDKPLESSLGENIGAILGLQIGKSIERRSEIDGFGIDYGRSRVILNRPLQQMTYESAEKTGTALEYLSQIVIWGRTWRYGDGIVAEVNASIPKYRDYRETRPEEWSLEFPGGQISVDLPRRRFPLGSIVLSDEIIEEYSVTKAFKVYESPSLTGSFRFSDANFRILTFLNDRVQVRAGDVFGWISLPSVFLNQSYATKFVSGIGNSMKGNWRLSIREFDKVLAGKNLSTSMRVDALLYRGMATEKIGGDGARYLELAFNLAPLSSQTYRYRVMGYVSKMNRLSAHDRAKVAMNALAFIEENDNFHPKTDQWVRSVRKYFEEN